MAQKKYGNKDFYAFAEVMETKIFKSEALDAALEIILKLQKEPALLDDRSALEKKEEENNENLYSVDNFTV